MEIRKTIGVRLYEDELAALRSIADREDRAGSVGGVYGSAV